MHRVTADSNIYISALLFGGKPLTLLEMAQEGQIELAVSDDLLTEAFGVLRDKFKRTPEQLTQDEADSLRLQFATLKAGRGQHRKYLPNAFTEHGAFMAATVLNSPQAIEMSVFVVRTFVKLRHLVLGHQELAAKLNQLERKVAGHDESIQQIVDAIRQLTSAPEPAPRRMGFHTIRERSKKEK